MLNSNKKNKTNNTRNARKLECTLSISFIIIGFLAAILFGVNPWHWDKTWQDILVAVSIELIASSAVVLVMMLFSTKNENSGTEEIKSQIAELQKEVHYGIDERYELMELLNSCIKEKDCKSRLVSEYIFGSGELSADSSSAEYHILSDELESYDFTAISTFAIANNVNRDNKYVYYLATNKVHLFNQLRERVAHYLKRDGVFKEEMEKWIRKTWIEKKQLKTDFCETLGVAINNIIEAYFKFSEDEIDQKKELQALFKALDEKRNGNILLPDSVMNWFAIKSFVKDIDDEELDAFAKKVDAILDFATKHERNIVNTNAKKRNEILYVLEMFSVMYHFSQYMIHGIELDKETQDTIFDPKVFAHDQSIAELKKQKKNVEVLKNWITGLTVIDPNSIDKKLEENLLYVDLGCEPKIKLCYSFCLYIHTKKSNGNDVTKAEMSWYACNEAFEIAKEQATEGIVDTVMFIYTPQNDAVKTQQLFIVLQKLIADNAKAQMTLSKANSKYLNLSKETIA